MSRTMTVGAAQMGGIQKAETRPEVVARMLVLLESARERGCDLVVYPELCLTTFFPRYVIDDPAELDAYYEAEMPGPDTAPLFERAAAYGIGFSFGYAELFVEDGQRRRFNTSILVDAAGNLQSFDLIVAVNDRRVLTFAELVDALDDFDPGDVVTVHLDRAGRALALDVELAEL